MPLNNNNPQPSSTEYTLTSWAWAAWVQPGTGNSGPWPETFHLRSQAPPCDQTWTSGATAAEIFSSSNEQVYKRNNLWSVLQPGSRSRGPRLQWRFSRAQWPPSLLKQVCVSFLQTVWQESQKLHAVSNTQIHNQHKKALILFPSRFWRLKRPVTEASACINNRFCMKW